MTTLIARTLCAFAGCAVALASAPAAADGLPDEPLARFEEPLCPGIIGLEAGFATSMVDRIRENAQGLGLQLADADDCEPNLVVIVLEDGRDYLQRLAADRPHLFEPLDRSARQALLEEEAPTRAWVSTESRTRDGLRYGRRINLADVPQAAMWSAHSLIYTPTREDILASMVLIDRDAASGLNARQMADYATLYGLADFVPQAAPGVPTIQTLFAGGSSAPEGLSDFDMAYLDRLYSSIPNLPANTRLAGLEGMAHTE
ncbi:hypothetical protein [Alteraurantiacibacter aquimixticola]|uniref:DUF2927 domain-containing protein n=1 Tax=Alteraurantiacibacter aquimixticola TaxID=2489173 RepID=A0A4T3EWH8_9SPHN|nr:hypothetical protein [Alteraurantiacibacter aquimixticola]TIX48788.1 hypothetical protein E5222_13645 [Alteraurantiacibacter aquimixticola]